MEIQKQRLGVLASGNGSNLEAIVQASYLPTNPFHVVVVLSDHQDAFALKRAENHNIPPFWVPYRKNAPKETNEKLMVDLLNQYQCDWIILAGFMRILSPNFVQQFEGRILNIHPSLLPSFPGKDAIRQAFEYGVKITGCTVHFVDSGIDTGPIIMQRWLEIEESDTLESLTRRIHELEHKVYTEAIVKVISHQVVYTQTLNLQGET